MRIHGRESAGFSSIAGVGLGRMTSGTDTTPGSDPQLPVPLHITRDACVGAVAAHLIRRIAFQCGAYVEDMRDGYLNSLNWKHTGATLTMVREWISINLAEIHRGGYRVFARWCTEPTDVLVDWVERGSGRRSALVATNAERLYGHPGLYEGIDHAVGLALTQGGGPVLAIDALPKAPRPGALPTLLDDARREAKNEALVFFWGGWS